jgi:membrane protein required for colicin V production
MSDKGGDGVNWLDWVIIGVFGYLILLGYRKGFVQQLFDVVGSVAALIIAFIYYPRLGKVLTEWIHFSTAFTNILGFVLIVVLTSGTVSYLGKRWRAKREHESLALVDSGLGAVFGGAKAAVIMIMVLLVLLSLPWGVLHSQIGASALSQDLLRLTPLFYQLQERTLPKGFPQMIVAPEGLNLRPIDYSKLKTATCVNCGAKVEYRGLVKQGLLSYPQFYCPRCRRVSDGCLTFEGYHMLKGKCPYEALGRDGAYDCQIWPNPKPTVVHGRCPVCGRRR